MTSLFRFRNKYRTDLSPGEVASRIDQRLKSRSKILFFTVRHYFGAVNEREFSLAANQDMWGLMSGTLKGKIKNERETIVSTRIAFPCFLTTIFMFVSLTALHSILSADEMTVNGEVRHITMSFKFLMVLLVFVFPGVMIFWTTIYPVKKIELKLIRILDLRRVIRSTNSARQKRINQ